MTSGNVAWGTQHLDRPLAGTIRLPLHLVSEISLEITTHNSSVRYEPRTPTCKKAVSGEHKLTLSGLRASKARIFLPCIFGQQVAEAEQVSDYAHQEPRSTKYCKERRQIKVKDERSTTGPAKVACIHTGRDNEPNEKQFRPAARCGTCRWFDTSRCTRLASSSPKL